MRKNALVVIKGVVQNYQQAHTGIYPTYDFSLTTLQPNVMLLLDVRLGESSCNGGLPVACGRPSTKKKKWVGSMLVLARK